VLLCCCVVGVVALLRRCVVASLRCCVVLLLCCCVVVWLCRIVSDCVGSRGCAVASLRGCVGLCGCVVASLCGCVVAWLCRIVSSCCCVVAWLRRCVSLPVLACMFAGVSLVVTHVTMTLEYKTWLPGVAPEACCVPPKYTIFPLQMSIPSFVFSYFFCNM